MFDARQAFVEAFGDASDVVVAQAPGRVNLMGGHVDYNLGRVLPMTIDRGVQVAARRRPDTSLRLLAADFDEVAEYELGEPPKSDRFSWVPYVGGIVHELHTRGLIASGVDVAVSGDVPIGAGLSSSAALEIATILALDKVFALRLEAKKAAALGREVEHRHAGVRCGIMDQLVVRLGRPGQALAIDCRSLEVVDVPLNLPAHRIMILDSGVRRELADSGYNQRRYECEEAVGLLRALEPSIASLRDLSREMLERHGDRLPPVTLARCRHVTSEIQRVDEASDCLRAGKPESLGRLMNESHASLRDDYEVGHPTVELLAERTLSLEGVLGARITGGGFGGSLVALVAESAVENVTRSLRDALAETGAPGAVMVVGSQLQAG